MNSREQIFHSIKKHQPSHAPLPRIPLFDEEDSKLVALFCMNLEAVGGRAITSRKKKDLNALVAENYPETKNCWSEVDSVQSINVNKTSIGDAHELKDVELVVLKGEFGVAENGAVWIAEPQLSYRVLPFIIQNLMIVLERSTLVLNMHQAIKQINMTENGGFGVFISGPSKTADIEQSLVIGAHGSRSLSVILI